MIAQVFFDTSKNLWYIVCRYRDHDQCIFAAYFDPAVAYREVLSLRKEYPGAVIALRVSDYS